MYVMLRTCTIFKISVTLLHININGVAVTNAEHILVISEKEKFLS